jgi:superfamily II DNA helicase RecQ
MEEAFRAEYGQLSELRSMVRREVAFVALTATATDAVRKTIIKDLCLTDCVQLLTMPNKPHTKFSVESAVVNDLYSTFSWLIDELEEKQWGASKVLVFCRKREHVRELFHEHLGEKSYVCPTGTEPKDDRTKLFAMYHRRTHKPVKETVEKEFCKADGTVRVVFCTVAFGMGVDVKGAQLVVHLGPSSALDDYLQECGRCGRDTTSMSHAVLLKYKGCTGSRHISRAMKQYVRNSTECCRVILLKAFSDESPKTSDAGHACCDICSKNCKCKCSCSEPRLCLPRQMSS